MKQINLWKFLPVVVLLAIGTYWLFDRNGYPYFVGLITVMVGTAGLGMRIRLGRLPWFETSDGRKARSIVWLESKIPFLRWDFWDKRKDR